MPVGLFRPAGEDPQSDRAADAHDSEIYRQGIGYLTSGRPSNPANDTTTRSWLRRMEGVNQRQAHRRDAQAKGGGKKGR